MQVAHFTNMLFNAKASVAFQTSWHISSRSYPASFYLVPVIAKAVFGSVSRCKWFSTGATLVEIVFNYLDVRRGALLLGRVFLFITNTIRPLMKQRYTEIITAQRTWIIFPVNLCGSDNICPLCLQKEAKSKSVAVSFNERTSVRRGLADYNNPKWQLMKRRFRKCQTSLF